MSTNKNASIRYQTLDRCFRNPGRKYYIENLIEECNIALQDFNNSTSGIKRRQIFDDIKFMRDSVGYCAPIESYKDGKRVYYRYEDINYSINNQPLNEREAQQLKESLFTLSRFKGLPQFEWIVELTARLEHDFHLKTGEQIMSFEENPYLKGIEHISNLFTAITNKTPLNIYYQPFNRETPIIQIIHPYHLKQYNNRWFLIGLNEERSMLTNIALDRIVSIEEESIQYKTNDAYDFNELFEDVVGVTIPYGENTQIIKLKIEKSLWPYIKTKPLHGSQKIKEENENYIFLELNLLPNYEFESLIFSHSERIEITEPIELRNKFKERVAKLFEKYI